MQSLTAAVAGTFRIGQELEINRLGFGAMRITGPGIWGEPHDRAEAIRTLKRLHELEINFVDTADSYGPNVSEPLLREALHPYPGMVIATKAGLARTGPDQWLPNGNPAYLIAQAKESLRLLGVEQIVLWQLHRIDPKVPAAEQFGAVKKLLEEGIIRFAGLSEVSVNQVKSASRIFKVATVQNHYNLINRQSEDVLNYCEQHGIGFIPWFPLAAGALARPGSVLGEIARNHGATPSQIALAWILRRSRVMLPIPGTSKVEHLVENVQAASIKLSDDEFAILNRAGQP